MSYTDVKNAMVRIRGAVSASQIAVFRGDNKGEVNAVFAATVETQRRIANRDRDPDLIGVYDGSMDLQEVERTLLKASQSPRKNN